MEKRTFLKNGLLAVAGAMVLPGLKSCKTGSETAKKTSMANLPAPKNMRSGDFTLPPLPYDFAALEPHFDKMTMEIHHDRHHAAYVKNLNDAVLNTPMAKFEIEDILPRLTDADADRKIRNNGGGHWNHSFFWKNLSPAAASGVPAGRFATDLNAQFGSMDKFKEQFSTAGKGVFGSGWAWLCVGADKKMFISATANQDNPWMTGLVKQIGTPILGLDVWEHAYYLKYQNKRPDYISAFFNIINWKEVGMRYEKVMG